MHKPTHSPFKCHCILSRTEVYSAFVLWPPRGLPKILRYYLLRVTTFSLNFDLYFCNLFFYKQIYNNRLWVYIISIINSHISTENIQRLPVTMWHSQCVLLLRSHPSIMLMPNINLLNSTHIICTHMYSAIVPNFSGYKILKDKGNTP